MTLHVVAGDAPVRVEVGGVAVEGAEVPAHYRSGGLFVASEQLTGDVDVYVGLDRSTLAG